MDSQQYGKLFSFIWNIANDVLVFAFEKGDYKKIILPFTVLQLIDATAISTPLKKNLGEKNCETSPADCDRILKLLKDFKEAPESKIFRNEEFGYWEVPVMRPKRDAEGNVVLKKGKPVIAKARNEVEQIPLTYPGGIEAFYEKEVKPYDDEATFGEPTIGYELSFTKYFYKPVELRTQDEIAAKISSLEKETAGLLREVLGGLAV